MKQSAYELLGLTAENKNIKKAYKRMVRQFPPEQHPDKFSEIQAAYEFLTTVRREAPAKFPLYLGKEEEDTTKVEEQTAPTTQKELLSEYFETPYNTIFDIKQLFKTT